jgi:hypothetical protein
MWSEWESRFAMVARDEQFEWMVVVSLAILVVLLLVVVAAAAFKRFFGFWPKILLPTSGEEYKARQAYAVLKAEVVAACVELDECWQKMPPDLKGVHYGYVMDVGLGVDRYEKAVRRLKWADWLIGFFDYRSLSMKPDVPPIPEPPPAHAEFLQLLGRRYPKDVILKHVLKQFNFDQGTTKAAT